MSWFKKEKKSGVPELPELPPMPLPLSPDEKEFPSLPSFPSSITGERMSRETVKQIISRREEAEEAPETEEVQRMPEFEEAPRMPRKEKGPIFIQIGKYHDILKALEEAKTKVKEISSAIEGLKEIKVKEEAELQEWENEILEVKERLSKVDSTIFKNLE